MYILKNVIKSITRNRTRNILILIVIVIISISCCVSLSIKNSANKLIESYNSSNEIIGKLTVNRENLRKDVKSKKSETDDSSSNILENLSKLTIDDIKNYGESIYVKSYYYTIQTDMNSSNIQKASLDNQQENLESDDKFKLDDFKNSNTGKSSTVKGDFSVIGYSSLSAMSEFEDGTYKIVKGTIFDEESSGKCVISEELAEENDLDIGSKILLENPNNVEETFELEICGIYSDSTQNSEFSMFSNSANKILTTYNTVNDIVESSSDDNKLNSQFDASFVLISKNVISGFEEELQEKGLSSYYTLTTNNEDVENSLKPIQNLSNYASIFLLIVLIVGGVILLIINMINIRERKYEIGVLRSIGMKKGLVSIQFILETFIVTLVAVLIGTIIGSIITVPVANKMLESEISSLLQERQNINQNFGMDSKMQKSIEPDADIRDTYKNGNYITKLNAVIDFNVVLKLILISILLTFISSVISTITILRYSPLKILSSRS